MWQRHPKARRGRVEADGRADVVACCAWGMEGSRLGSVSHAAQVVIATGPQRVATTDAAAYITLIGEWRASEKIPLLTAGLDAMPLFRAGTTETFTGSDAGAH